MILLPSLSSLHQSIDPRRALTLLLLVATWLASGCAMLAPGLVGAPSKAIPPASLRAWTGATPRNP